MGESQFLLVEKLQCAVTLRVDGVSKASVNGRKHRNNRTRFVIISDVFDLLANRKLRHRKLLSGIIDAIISPQAGDSFLTMYLPKFRTMVVALMSHLDLEGAVPGRVTTRSGLDLSGPGEA